MAIRSVPQAFIFCYSALALVAFALLATHAHSAERADRIEEASFVSIGGIDQWVTIRGAKRSNPILLIVHGGPADPQSPLISTYEPYEHKFVVVQWDQRGAGKTFGRNRDIVKELSLERMAEDGVELAAYLCKHLGQKNVIVLGHSWGTTLATAMVKRTPNLFAAYFGTGQVASWREGVREQWKYLHSAAEAAQDQPTLKLLQGIGEPDPYNTTQYFSWRLVLNRKYQGPADTAWLKDLRALVAASPGMSEADLKMLSEGGNFTFPALIRVLMTTELATTATAMPVPFFVIQGKDDTYTPTKLAVDYFNSVTAPKKGLTVIEGAGHFALNTHREEFIKALVSDIQSVNK